MTDEMPPTRWKRFDADTPVHIPIVVAKPLMAASGAGWSYASFDYAVASYQTDGDLLGWNDGEPLTGYTLWSEFTPPCIEDIP